jgi:hypothetical protein
VTACCERFCDVAADEPGTAGDERLHGGGSDTAIQKGRGVDAVLSPSVGRFAPTPPITMSNIELLGDEFAEALVPLLTLQAFHRWPPSVSRRCDKSY